MEGTLNGCNNATEVMGTQYPFPYFSQEMITRLVRLDNQKKGNLDVKKIGEYVLCPQLLDCSWKTSYFRQYSSPVIEIFWNLRKILVEYSSKI
jgi:hypothetical protein